MMRLRKKDRRPQALLLTILLLVVMWAGITMMSGKGVGEQFSAWGSVRQAWNNWQPEQLVNSAKQKTSELLGFVAGGSAQDGAELVYTPPVDPKQDPAGHAAQMFDNEAKQRFRQGTKMLQAGDASGAIAQLHRALQIAPEMVDAQVNIGYAFLMLDEYKKAHDFFQGALVLNPSQANAYYGLGAAYEGLEELELAMGAMRSFIHVVKQDDPAHTYANRARSALWEWDAQLGRGPWGSDKGIPNGMTAADVRRDGKPVTTLRPFKPGQDMGGKLKEYRLERKAKAAAQVTSLTGKQTVEATIEATSQTAGQSEDTVAGKG